MVRRGSTGDDSGNDFGGGGYDNDTSAGSGVTGDSGSDTSYGGGGYDSGGSSPSAGDSGTESSDFGGGGGDDDSDYDPNPSNRSTGSDRDLNDITGGRNYGGQQPQSTGDSPSRNQGGAGGSGTGSTSGDAESASPSGDDGSSVDVETGETSDRGVGVTRGPEGREMVVPAEGPVQQSVREARQTRRAETRAAVNRFGHQQLGAVGATAGMARVSEGPAVQVAQEGRTAQEDSFFGGLTQGAGLLQAGPAYVDALAGRTDEAVGGAVSNLREGDVRGAVESLTPAGTQGTINRVNRISQALSSGRYARAGDLAVGQADEAIADYAGGADVLAGSTDEAVGRATRRAGRGNYRGAADALLGDFDESYARTIDAASRGDVAGIGDAVAGGLDEYTGRLVNLSYEGGDVLAGRADERFGQAVDAFSRGDFSTGTDRLAQAGDTAAGDTDEQISRAVSAAAEGDLDRAAGGMDESAGRIARGFTQTDNAYEYATLLGDELAGSMDEYVARAEFRSPVAADLTQSGGFLTEEQEAKLATASENFREDTSGYIDTATDLTYGGLSQARRKGLRAGGVNPNMSVGIGPVQFNAYEGGEGFTERAVEGLAESVVGAGNPFMWASVGETGTEVVENAPETARTYGSAAVAGTATAFARESGEQAVEQAAKNPARTVGSLAGEVLLGAGVGRVTSSAFRKVRGWQTARGIPDDRRVDFDEIQREDIASGQSRLTRHSERAVGEDAPHSMPDEDFPVEPAENPAEELRRLGEEHSTSKIEEALNLREGETPLYHATGRKKGDTYEARSYRPYDPDAIYFAGSVSKNFLPDAGTPEGFSLGLRRPKPIKAIRSLWNNEQPTIVASAGRVEQMPDEIGTRMAVSKFLRENANNNRFYVQSQARQSGEAEALTAAHAAKKEAPWPGAGIIEKGEGTEFVNLNNPLLTEIRGENVLIQTMRQRGWREAGDTDVPEDAEIVSEEEVAETMRRSGTPGGEPGTPVVPTVGIGGQPAVSQPAAGGQPSSPFASVEEDLQNLFGGPRITGGDRGRTTRGDMVADSRRRSDQSDTTEIPDDRELPGDWRGEVPDDPNTVARFYQDRESGTSRPRQSDQRQGQGYASPGRGGDSYDDYVDRVQSYVGGGGVSYEEPRITGSGGGGSSPTPETPTSPPTYEPPTSPPNEPPTSPPTRGPPTTYPPSPPSSPPLSPPPSTPPVTPPSYPPTGYPPYPPNSRPRTERQGEEEVERQQFGIPFDVWDRAWVNPVASAQTAWEQTIGAGAEWPQVGGGGLDADGMLGAVAEDLERYR